MLLMYEKASVGYSPRYKLNRSILTYYINSPFNTIVAAKKNGKLEGFSVFHKFSSDEWHYSFNCARRVYPGVSLSLIHYFCSLHSDEHGAEVKLLLGGGINKGDGLERFKAEIVNASQPSYWLRHIRIVVDPNLYSEYCGAVKGEDSIFP